jgi:hypothetical protein
MFFSRIVEIGDLVFVIGAIDELNFGMGFLEGKSPEGERHNKTSLNGYVIFYYDIFVSVNYSPGKVPIKKIYKQK